MTMSSIPTSREQLWALLAEAAEIEHHLMCCYLYAAFSLNEANAKNVQDLLLIIEPVTHEVLGDLVWRGNRYVFVDCYGTEYEMKTGYQIRTTQDLC